jgi:hypothetical protein
VGHPGHYHQSFEARVLGDKFVKLSSFLERLRLFVKNLRNKGWCGLTCHGSIDAPHVGEESKFGKLDSKGGSFGHFVFENFGALV